MPAIRPGASITESPGVTAHRYAVYAVPPAGSLLERRAEAWLGRSARTGEAVARPPALAPHADTIDAVTASPRRYGFHGTLRAPMRLAAGRSADDLAEAVSAVARRHAPFALPLALGALGGFLALLPEGPAPAIAALHADVLAATDPLRAPPDAAETARRRAAGLSPEEETLLSRWGYPYVLERFRFHMTLTERLGPEEAARIRPLAREFLGDALAAAMPVEAIALFAEPAAGAPFLEVERIALSGAAPATEDAETP
jgi:putative phosphonate metabolism protein